MVYRTIVRDIIDKQHRITVTGITVTLNMLARTWQEIEHGMDILHAIDGAHVEIYKYM